jgi:succinate dehydrogenase / fumarate reductase membrane anchor subunit
MILEILSKRYPGLRAWLLQRITGLVIAIYSVGFFVRLLVTQPNSFEAWYAFFDPCWMRVATLLLWLSLSEHAWLGVRDVLKDYVPNVGVRTVLTKLVATALWLYMAWAIWLLYTF